jgi:hypothetical protein
MTTTTTTTTTRTTMTPSQNKPSNPEPTEDDELSRYLKMGDRIRTGCIGTCPDCTPECPVYDPSQAKKPQGKATP